MNITLESFDPIINLSKVSFAYEIHPVVNAISLSIKNGEFVGVIGPNGSGKSTLLKLISGILHPDQGKVAFKGKNIESIKRRELAQSLAWIPQESHLAFPYQAIEVVLMGRHPYLSPLAFEGEEDIFIAERAMELTDTRQFSSRLLTEISGGEKQRVMLASAMTQEPEVMILDEPTSALDIKYQIEILNILKQLREERKLTLVLAMHDLHLASKFCQRLILLDEGKMVCEGKPEEVLKKSILERVYGIRVKIFTDQDDGSLIICPG